MITVLVNREVYRQVRSSLHSRKYWMEFAREDPRQVQVWETTDRKSWRLL